jgi:hypothetical protein
VVIGLAPIPADAVAGASIARRDIGFHADNRLEPRFLGFFLELPRAVKVTVIGYCEGGLFELQRSVDEIIDAVGAVEKRVFRVAMEVDEGHMIRICDAVSSR